MKKTLLLLTAVSIVASVSFGLARGDHGGGADHDHADKNTNLTWCDVDPACNGSAVYFAKLRAANEVQARAAQALRYAPVIVVAPKPQRQAARTPEPAPRRATAVQRAPLDLVPPHLRVAYDAVALR